MWAQPTGYLPRHSGVVRSSWWASCSALIRYRAERVRVPDRVVPPPVVGLAGELEDPARHRHVDTEVGGDLLDGDAALAATGDRDNFLAGLFGIGTGHDDILPASASRH